MTDQPNPDAHFIALTPPNGNPPPPASPLQDQPIPDAPRVAPSSLPRGVWEALSTNHGLRSDQLLGIERHYQNRVESQTGYPLVTDLTASDAAWLICIESADTNQWSFDVLKQRQQTGQAQAEQANNIWMPVVQSEDTTEPNQWTQALASIEPEVAKAFNASVEEQGRAIGAQPTPPVTRFPGVLSDVVEKAISFLSLLDHSVSGGPRATFAWRCGAMTLGIFGLGSDALLSFAQQYAHTDPIWAALLQQDDRERANLLQTCHRATGFPAGVPALPWGTIVPVLAATGTDLPFLHSRVLIHILAHTRISLVDRANPQIIVAYAGNYAVFPLEPEALHMPLSALARPLLAQFTRVLQLPLKAGKHTCATVMQVLEAIHLHNLIGTKDPTTAWDIISGPEIQLRQVPIPDPDPIFNPGLAARGLATVDHATGTVRLDEEITGENVLSYALAPSASRVDLAMRFRASIPERVIAQRPSQVIRAAIHNFNDLGHRDGCDALLDAALLLDVLRSSARLEGRVPAGLSVEYPPLVILANAGTAEGTTNQGKTALARTLGNIMVPGIKEQVFNRQSSAPAQRTSFDSIVKHGTAVFDEFILPQAHDHVFGKEGLQALATGSNGGPGRALENATPIGLRHLLVLSMKIAALPPDLMNRMIFLFLDPLHEGNSCTPEELSDIMCGKVAMCARLGLLRWAEEQQMISKIAKLWPSTSWRFNGHAAVAEMLADDPADVKAYLDAAHMRAEALRQEANVTSLAADIGVEQGFSFAALVNLLPAHKLDHIFELYGQYNQTTGWRMQDALLHIARPDALDATAARVGLTQEYHKPLTTLLAQMGTQLSEHPVEAHGFRIERKTRKDAHGKDVPIIVMTKLGQ